MEKIDWNYWLKSKTLLEIQIALLTLGVDPEKFEIDYLDGHYLVHIDDLKDMKKDYLKRLTVIKDYRLASYPYMNDGDWGSSFYASNGKVLVKRFLLWLKNEDMGWELPKQMVAFIDSMNASDGKKIKAKPVLPGSIQREQERAILDAIKELQYDPLNLPSPEKAGVRGVKSVIRTHLLGHALFSNSSDKFNNAWKRLLGFGDIKNSK
jgi:hypothetical protein